MPVVQALLGLQVDIPSGEVRVNALRPGSDLTVRGLTIGGQRIDVIVDRDATATVSGLPFNVRLTDANAPTRTPA